MNALQFGYQDTDTAVLIVNFNCSDFTIRAVQSALATESGTGLRVQVVDNGSSSEDAERLRRLEHPLLHVKCLTENTGFARGYNAAARAAWEKWRPKHLVIMNQDCEIGMAGAIKRLVSILEACGKDTAGIQPLIHDYRYTDDPRSRAQVRRLPSFLDLLAADSIVLRPIFRSRHALCIAPCRPGLSLPAGAFHRGPTLSRRIDEI
jgi:GT2 family glycosyltransferase